MLLCTQPKWHPNFLEKKLLIYIVYYIISLLCYELCIHDLTSSVA